VTQVLQFGPFAVPLALLVGIVAVGLGFVAGNRAARAAGIDAEPALFRALLVGLVTARLAFVWQWREVYLREPLGILDIRDGGWDIALGGAAAFLYGLSLVKRRAELKRPLLRAGAVAAGLGLSGTLALLALPGQNMRLPAFEVQALEGPPVALHDFAGKPVVLNLWASWCPPCRREMPMLEQAQAAHPEVHFVFLNQGESAQAVNRYLAAEKIGLRNVLLDKLQQASAALGRLALPTTLFFDAEGRLVSSRVGELSEATLLDRLGGLGVAGTTGAANRRVLGDQSSEEPLLRERASGEPPPHAHPLADRPSGEPVPSDGSGG
jgi:thiol-disulfide isomerase/thioredoxin